MSLLVGTRRVFLGTSDNAKNLFDVNFETGDTSQFDSVTNPDDDITIDSSGAMGRTNNGMSVLIDDTTAVYGEVDQTPPSGEQIRVRFYIDPNSLTMDAWQVAQVFRLVLSASPNQLAMFELQWTGGTYRIKSYIYRDSAGRDDDTADISDAPHYIEFHIIRGAGTGRAEWWIDGASQGSWTSLDNDTTFDLLTKCRVGVTATGHANTSGTFYIDELAANDNGLEIGA